MGNFFAQNTGTICIGLALAVVIGLIVRKLYHDHKRGGGCSCGCGCDHCSSQGACHKN